MTFHAYQRSIRINYAFSQMKNGEQVTGTAYDVGYQSLSGFQTAFRNITDSIPSAAQRLNTIVIKRITTPLGPMLTGISETGLCLLEFTDRPMLETQLERVCKRLKARMIHGHHDLMEDLQEEIEAYFRGSVKGFQTPLDLGSTSFHEEVRQLLKSIPYGSTRSHKEQAEMLGRKNAIRAVARTNRDNRISIIIPCHRVVRSNVQLTGYGDGLWRKRWHLEHEHNNL